MNSTKASLIERSNNQCELCSNKSDLNIYELPLSPISGVESSILCCDNCQNQIESTELVDTNHWRCLNDSMWSEFPPVQVMSYRLLSRLKAESWALDLLDQIYLSDDALLWAKSGLEDEVNEDTTPTKDSNGTILVCGDQVTLIKDLVVKGANFTAKRGTIVKNISLTSNPEHIEGKVNGTQIVLLTCFLKKA